ncbi:hypothetical protein [Bradyrhizobium sp. JYMT SZCCT0428]|uniref:hypothetical protein n=1 Tax=Bradyrhizobium sp. JYMT SZCCT0428 TaxID=2807673 RepID=UPI001BA9488B|nr:hypothetical protein [Bradyrhizobium sp. JYMT SZCCT0428]MBR1156664.1 hypothetical protein [Bradyrhizobium sp. JYMT SZCCT0428]
MPLHRDIHWIGRQWAVTGLGMQLIDQKLKGFFDIEIPQLWDEALIETMRAKEWLNVADFDKGLEVARKRFPPGGVTQPPTAATPGQPVALAAVPEAQPVPPVASAPPIVSAPVITSIKPIRKTPAPVQITTPAELHPQAPEMIEPAKSARAEFQMRFLGHGKFIRPWRVRMKE